MSKLGLAIAGTLATGVIGAGAFIGYQQLSNKSNTISNTNSNVTVQQANSNTANSNVNKAQAFKNELIGTWVGVDDPKKKVTFTADEMIGLENGKENKLKYTRLSNDEIEFVFDGKKGQLKTTFEGEVLTITGDGAVKFRRESSGATASNTSPPAPTDSSNPQTFKNSIEMEFVKIPAGSFLMGSATSEHYREPNEGPQRQVTLSQEFYLGTTEVTQEQYEKVMGSNPSSFKGCPKCPVETVLWEDAQEFIKKLNAKNEGVYRLPTEAEWEYAARAGTTGDYAGDLDSMAWYISNSGGKTHPVATKQANAWGLYDMHGNVFEWCEDIYSDDYTGLPADGSANVSVGDSGTRILRGGSWRYYAYRARSAFRAAAKTYLYRDERVDFGFRVLARLR